MVTMVMRCGGTVQGIWTMWDWNSSAAGDELEMIKEGLWPQSGNFDRQGKCGGKQLLEEARAEIDFQIMQQGEIGIIWAIKTG